MSRIEVVYTASRNLYPYLMASVRSLLDYNPDARVWMLIEDDSLGYRPPQNVEVVNVSAQNVFSPETCVNWRTQFTYMSLLRTAYTKMFTGEPNGMGIRTLPKLDRILQMDVDTIVCDSLKPVWDIDLNGKWFAAAPDYEANYRPWGRRKYYNLGVCVFNLDQIRRDGVDDTVIRMCNERMMRFIDEMAWNKVNNDAGNRMSVDFDARYNQTSEVSQTLDPAVVHYAGIKQWWKDFDQMYRPLYMARYARYFELDKSSSEYRAQQIELGKLSSINWILKISDDGKIKYIMENGKYPVLQESTYYDTIRKLNHNAVRISREIPGYPITVDGKFFYEGEAEAWDNDGKDDRKYAVQLGADGLPILAYAE